MKRVPLRGPGLLLAMVSLGAPAWAATYYLDAAAGEDGRTGTSETTAWKTLAKASKAVANVCNNVLYNDKGGNGNADGPAVASLDGYNGFRSF